MMTYEESREFKKEFKKLAKKYRSLHEDLEEFKKVVSVVPLGNRKHFNIITQTAAVKIIKARFFCRYLKGSSLRLIYAYFEQFNRIEFIEIYFKGHKENENRERIDEVVKACE